MTYRIMLLVELTRLSDMSDNLVDINLYSLVFRGKEFVKGTMLPAQRISPQPAGTLVT